MKKGLVFCLAFIFSLTLASCGSESQNTTLEEVDFTIIPLHYNCTPQEVIDYLNSDNASDDYYVIPDFVSSKKEIAIPANAEKAYIYLTFQTDEQGYMTELSWYFRAIVAPEKSTNSFTHYMSLLLTKLVDHPESTADSVQEILNSFSMENSGITMEGTTGSIITTFTQWGECTVQIRPDPTKY